MKVGILELISFTVPPEWQAPHAESFLRRHLHGLMPQVVSVWARRLGHEVHYATYFGQSDPMRLLPDGLDVVFISVATQGCLLAYALAKAWRLGGTRTVLGGAHAKCFPADAIRFFDIVVAGACDENLVAEILAGRVEPGSIVSAAARPTVFPSVAERAAEIGRASGPARPFGLRVVGLLGSVGCPYACDFCTDWNAPYQPVDSVGLTADVRHIARHHPNAVAVYHDANFGVRFDRTLDAIEAAGPPYPPFVTNCSLSVLRDDRLARLRRVNCIFLSLGIESWYDFGDKTLAGEKKGGEKVDGMVGRFHDVRRFVPGLQANFVFGTEADAGRRPAELTIDFIRRAPYLWPNVNIPTPYGGTPLFDRHLAEDRIQRAMPLAFYCSPYLVTRLKNYDAAAYYELLIGIMETATGRSITLRRVLARNVWGVRAAHLSQSLAYRTQLDEMRQVLALLRSDRQFRAFHENLSATLPEFYRRRIRQRLGRYAELMTEGDCRPVLEPAYVQTIGRSEDADGERRWPREQAGRIAWAEKG